jgi:hypothetical protein
VTLTLYILVRAQFDFTFFDPILKSDEDSSTDVVGCNLMNDILSGLKRSEIKLRAAFAKMRVERKAVGGSHEEILSRVLDDEAQEKDQIAGTFYQ